MFIAIFHFISLGKKKKKILHYFHQQKGYNSDFFLRHLVTQLPEQAKTIELPFLFLFIFINENKILGWVLIKISYMALVLALSLTSIEPKVFKEIFFTFMHQMTQFLLLSNTINLIFSILLSKKESAHFMYCDEMRKCLSLNRVLLFVTSWIVAHQSPLSMEFSS